MDADAFLRPLKGTPAAAPPHKGTRRDATMDADTVQALRDAKALFDEGILSEQEFKEKKAELLQPKAAPAATKPKPKPKPAPKKKSEAKPKAEKKPKKSTASSDGSEKEKKAPRVAELTLQDAGEDGVLVTGSGTFRAKSLLASLGGSWSKKLKAWVFGAGTAHATAAALKASTAPAISLTVAEGGAGAAKRRESSLASAKAEALAAAATAGASATFEAVWKSTSASGALMNRHRHAVEQASRCPHRLEVCKHKRAVLVKGDTKNVKPVLQALEGSWNKGLGGWVFPMKKREEVLAALRQDPTNTINEDPALVAEAAKVVKAEPVAEKRKSVDAADAPEAKRQSLDGEQLYPPSA